MMQMIDIQAVKGAYQSSETIEVAFVRSEYDIADALTKSKSDLIMIDSLNSRKFDQSIEQWIISSE